jgi:chromosome partitioning protein
MIGRDYRLTKDMREAAKALQLSLVETPITLRQAYADAPGQATFVWKMGYSARDAAEEIDQLFRELVPEAVAKNIVAIEGGRGKKKRANE